jgi:ELWxxDGT repeat protein
MCTAQTQPKLVADLSPGSRNTRFGSAVSFKNKLVFVADNKDSITFPQKLWISDGSSSGTYILKDFGSGNYPRAFTELYGKLYFAAYENSSGWELWCTDGTTAGTYMVKEINTGSYSGIIGNIVTLNDKLYFLADDGNGVDVWTSDGSVAGTYSLINLNLGNGFGTSIENFVTINNKLFFTQAPSGIGNTKLWVVDPEMKSASPFNLSGQLSYGMIVAGNKMYFTIVNPTPFGNPDFSFYVSNGTPEGTNLLVYRMRHYNSYAEMAGKLYFYASSSYNSTNSVDGIWVTDGTVAGTKSVKDTILDNCFSSTDPRTIPLTVFKNKLYFGCGGTKAYNNELWVSDGTTAGTYAMKAFSPQGTGWQYMYPRSFVATDDYFYFKCWDDYTGRVNLWISDGTVKGTYIVPPPAVSGIQTTNICGIVTSTTKIVDTTIFFTNSYDSNNTGLELYTLPTLKKTKDTVADTIDVPFSVQVYPNPTAGELWVRITSDEPLSYIMSLTGIDGKIVRPPQEVMHTTAGSKVRSYPLNNLPNGIYIIQIATDKLAQKHKIVLYR